MQTLCCNIDRCYSNSTLPVVELVRIELNCELTSLMKTVMCMYTAEMFVYFVRFTDPLPLPLNPAVILRSTVTW